MYVGYFDIEYRPDDCVTPVETKPERSFRERATELVWESPIGGDELRETGGWVGFRTVTPDGRPFGETELDGFVVAYGMNGLGVTLVPIVGETVAEQLADGTRFDDRRSPSRFD